MTMLRLTFSAVGSKCRARRQAFFSMFRHVSVPCSRSAFAGVVAAWTWFFAHTLCAAPLDNGLVIVVHGRRDTCVNAEVLRTSVARYAKRLDGATGLGVQVERTRGGMQFSLARGERVLARRYFDTAPSACEDRRETLAVAIALAVDHAVAAMDEPVSTESISPDAPTDVAEVAASTAGSSVATGSGAGSTLETRDRAVSNAAETTTQNETRIAQLSAAEPEPPPSAANDSPPPPPAADVAETLEPSDDPDRNGPDEPAESTGRDGPVALLRAGARQLWQVLPKPVPVLAAGVELPIGMHAGLQLSGLVSMAVRSNLASRQFRTQLFAMETLGCGVLGLGPLSLHGCGGVAGGAVAASGEGFDRNTSATLVWVAALARASLSAPTSWPFRVCLFGDAFVNVVQPRMQALGSTLKTAEMPAGMAAGVEFIVVWP